MDTHFDIIIVGAGPAGSSAALYADRAGLSTVLVDRSFFPRDKICGDALSGKSIKYLRELNLLDSLKTMPGSVINRIVFGSPNHKIIDINLTGSNDISKIKSGYVISRENFDSYLFEKAKNVTHTRQGFSVKDIIFDNDKIIGVQGIENGRKINLYAPIILGCDGANSIIARKLGVFQADLDNTAIAIRCYYKGVKDLTDQIELHFVDEVLPGYFWLFPVGENISNIGIGLRKKEAKKDKRTLNQILKEVIDSNYFKDRFSKSKPIENPKGWSLPLGRKSRPNCGAGYMLLGDAAGLIDPFTGEGIGNAIVSAKYAIKVALKAIEENNFERSYISKYNNLVWSNLGPELRTSARLQDLARYRMLLNLVISKAANKTEIQNIISGMLVNEVPKEKLSNPLFYLKLLLS